MRSRTLSPGIWLSVLGAAACSSGGTGPSYTPGTDLPASEADAARFLTQATYGPDERSLARLQQLGYTTWLQEQFEAPPSLHRPELSGRASGGETIGQAQRQEMWWRRAITAPDQLRQRVAFALSQIFVISDRASALSGDAVGMAEYYDLLVRGAFGSYRELLEQITLSPQMGNYLSMLRNRKPDAARNLKPDENYAREIMQLFSIGLVQLELDGSVKRDGQGNALPTYEQDDIVGLAHVFTGWTYAGSTGFYSGTPSFLPMEPFENYHDRNPKALLGGIAFAAERDARVELEDFLDRLAAHDNVAPFLCKQLIQRLVTSNPTPAYVRRVVGVWLDDGSGARGNLGAVVRAILLDQEAREGHRTAASTFGKLREPLLRQTALWRAFGARADNGRFTYSNPESALGQAALRAETVFNFYRPDHVPQGVATQSGLAAPEFEILTHSTITTTTNQLYTSIFNRRRGATGTTAEQVLIDLDAAIALAADPTALLAWLDVRLLCGQMSSELRTLLLTHLGGETDHTQRAMDAVYLIVTSPEFAVQK